MITLNELTEIAKNKLNLDEEAILYLTNNFDKANKAALIASYKMPGIGILSKDKRINAFLSICLFLDTLIDTNEINMEQSQIALMILRLKNKDFQKAISTFDMMIYQRRFSLRARAEMPRVAWEYTNGINRQCGYSL